MAEGRGGELGEDKGWRPTSFLGWGISYISVWYIRAQWRRVDLLQGWRQMISRSEQVQGQKTVMGSDDYQAGRPWSQWNGPYLDSAMCRCWNVALSTFFSLFFLGLHPWHREVPRLGVQSELHLPAYVTSTAMPDPSDICDLWHSFGIAGSLTHWARPGIEPASSPTLCRVLNPLEPQRELPLLTF